MPKPQSILLWVIFLVVLTAHFKSRVSTSFDSKYSIPLAISLLEEGNLDLDEYRDLIPKGDYRVIEVDGRLHSRYPVGPSVVAAPFVKVIDTFAKHGLYISDLDTHLRINSPRAVEKFISSFLVALTAVLTFHIARLRLGVGSSLLVVFVFAFCTSSWSVVSRGLWQHAPSMLFASAALYCLMRARDEPRWSQFSGLYVALAFAMRPTHGLAVILMTVFVLRSFRPWFLRYLGWASLVAVPLVGFHLSAFGSLLPSYYLQSSGHFNLLDPGFLTAAAGTLLSPGRGFFVYSPVFLFSLLGIALLIRQRRWSPLDSCLSILLLLHWIVISSWFNWWGGTVFGPRLFADLIPIALYFLFPVLELLDGSGWRRPALALGLALSIVASFLVHRLGAQSWATWDWNVVPTPVVEEPARLWDWSDPPFLRTVVHLHHPRH